MKLSIVIPVYNVDQYLEQCLNSVINQDISKRDYEIIIVNDGSSDDSLTIAENYAFKYDNIKILSQSNKGLSFARNIGLDTAKGDYIWFVDSDDYIKDNCLSEIIKSLYANDLDGLRIQSYNVVNGDVIPKYQSVLDGVVSGNECLKNRKTFRQVVWLTIYNRLFLLNNELKFHVGQYHEDNEFSIKAYYYMKRLAFSEQFLYYHRKTPGSIMQSPSLKRSIDSLEISSSLQRFVKEEVDCDMIPVINTYISFLINNSMDNALSLETFEQREVVKKLKDDISILDVFRNSSLSMLKMEGCLLKLFPSSCLSSYKLFKMVIQILR